MAHPKSKKAKNKRAKQSSGETEAERQKKLAARQERQQAEQKARDRKALAKKLRGIAAIAVLVVGVAGLAYWVLKPEPELAGVTTPRNDGRGHITNATYDTPTPTSGQHPASSPNCGSFTSPLDPGLAVHALEHGAVVLWYDAEQPELRAELDQMTRQWDSHVLIAPNANIDADVVATAWNRLKEYDRDDAEITEFVSTYRQRGPERESCDRV